MSQPTHLVLDVSRSWHGLRVALFEDFNGALAPRGYEIVDVEFAEIENIETELQFLLGRSNLVGEMGAAAGDEILRLAMLLFDLIVPAALKPILRRGRGALTLRLEESLQHLPWEMLHNGGEFLSRQYAMSRDVMVQGIHEPPLTRALEDRRRVLVIADPRGDLPAASREGTLLREGFLDRHDVELGFMASPITRASVRESLREFDIVHLAGHAEWDETGGGWLMVDGRFEPDDVRRLSGTRPMPTLVFANACSSGASTRPAEDTMATSFLAAGVRNYLGTIWDIPDDLGVLFAVAFYERLQLGLPIGEAVRRSRIELAERFGEGTALWGSYVLYGPPSQVYFGHREAQVRYLDPFEEAMPGRRLIHKPTLALQPARTSPIEPNPMLRGAMVAPESSLKSHVSRVQRGAILSLSTCMLLLLAIGFAFYGLRDDGRSSRNSPPSSPRDSSAPMFAAKESSEVRIPIESRTPLESELSVVAKLADQQGNIREVPLHRGDVLNSGDRVSVHFQTNRDAHAYLFFVDGHRHAQLLFPTVDGDAGEVSANEEVTLPEPENWYRLDDTPGVNVLILAVSERQIRDITTLLRDMDDLLEASAGHAINNKDGGLRLTPLQRVKERVSRESARVSLFEIEHRP
ncbi:MAG: hypothetical protein AUK47_09785 [Deltaproteobacteria bacterium CG2_30_63_29]|nr:MAG: hypothetical protein AUK47_09785 [Deltaproteobacteria bacterium CG2_30_63_29]PJB40561.1 MAG: hypothetical protein CO108_14495 [Deltaproteobacteria bacterium CG_4_9_14_3_um_filter_63_12]